MNTVVVLMGLIGVSLAMHCEDGMCNIAHGSLAYQSSTGWGGVASRAVDGVTNGRYSGRSCTHTQRQATNVWWASFPGSIFDMKYKVQKVSIHNRIDSCCYKRIDGAKVMIGNGETWKECGTIQYTAGTSVYTVECGGTVADKVKVELKNQYLTLCEVEVWVKEEDMPEMNYVNIARKGTASQSSIGWGGVPARAIDGKTSGQWRDGSCTHSQYNRGNSWSVSLPGYLFGTKYPISKVLIYNRLDCCSDRLRGAMVYVDGTSCGQITQPRGVNVVDCGGKAGGKITIKQGNNFLTLCEVEVYVKKEDAEIPDDQPKYVNIAREGTAIQASEGWRGSASRAIDGNTNGIYRMNSCTHSGRRDKGKWAVSFKGFEMGVKYPIFKVVIYNRVDCCQNRINNAKVYVDDQMCGQVKYDGSSVYAVDCKGVEGSSVSITVDNEWLTLCEVQVYVDEKKLPTVPEEIVNVMKGAKATQSSEGWGGKADRALDGNTDGRYSARSCTHSRYNKDNYWTAKMTETQSIKTVMIYNRVDCCSDRINGAEVLVAGQYCGRVNFNSKDLPRIRVECEKELEGNSIEIRQKSNYLTLCEVQAFPAPPENPSEAVDEE